MAENTKIEWAHHTFNPWIGCTKVSPGCDHCYAEADFATRRKVVQWGAGQPRKLTADSTWSLPLRWNAEAERQGVRYRVFCASLADVFDNEVPGGWRVELFRLIAETPHLDWLLLTKRVGNVVAMSGDAMLSALMRCSGEPWQLPRNVWIGATITSQAEADRDIQKLLAVPAARRFLSMEPLLGPVDLSQALAGFMQDFSAMGDVYIDWVIVGGESGPNARPMHPDWARLLRDQCQAAGVPFLFKQWGEWRPAETVQEAGLRPCIATNRELPSRAMSGCFHVEHQVEAMLDGKGQYAHVDCAMFKAGKKAAGRMLDGRTWDEVPS